MVHLRVDVARGLAHGAPPRKDAYMSRILHRSIGTRPPALAVGGQGVWLHTASCERILDGSGGAAVSCLGHGHPRVIAAIQQQAGALAFAHNGFLTSEPAEALAEALVGHEPGGLAWAYFVSGGSEAMEAALKLARQHFLESGQPARDRFIARRQGYHGNTLGALAASGNLGRRTPYLPILSDAFSHVSPAFAYRWQRDDETEAGYVARLAAELEAEFQRIGPGRVAAFVAETVAGATTGCVTAPAGYFRAMRDVCDRHGALLILDEVMCGMGRTGTLHAWEQEGVTPDIQIVAKGLGGGYQPIGAVLATDAVVAPIRGGSGDFAHGHTYLAHPTACAAALAVQQVIADDDLLPQVRQRGAYLEQRLHDRFGNHRHAGNIRGRGLFWAVEFVADRAAKEPFDPARKLHQRIRQAALARGLICYPSGGTADGVRGDHAILAPAYIASEDEIAQMVDRLAAAVEDAIAG